ncbi:elongation factor P maturation arginine rhamnosyltransferase EarP [Uliginosibacterium sp. sgz301328]|uniref:elongation factor P maturation arginine rhamnosyltransferase EarP n=1 Tax=Uliginosibacterium sp. sgz301328 TaxID=3243764 RepID=UPI00359CBF49
MTPTVPTWDLFCTVVDNFGDVGVCWRLARQLANEHGVPLRLWVDDLSALRSIAPAARDVPQQMLDGVDVRHWTPQSAASAEPADVVIEAFACELPAAYLASMARRAKRPVWINLEYLSAEDWVTGCHGLASTHPQLGLRKHFFFPGVRAGTGGLIKENWLDARRTAWLDDLAGQTDWWSRMGVAPPHSGALRVSLFSYENPALPGLLDAWAAGKQAVHCAVPAGRPLPAVAAWSGRDSLAPGDVIDAGALRLSVLPFMSQEDYDRLLWMSDLNFVRGEDSFVRAQWARRPFVWHIYRQDENAHMEKLHAFLEVYGEGLATDACAALQDAWIAWNEAPESIGKAWAALDLALPALRAHADQWAEARAKQGDLAGHLALFCKSLVE